MMIVMIYDVSVDDDDDDSNGDNDDNDDDFGGSEIDCGTW